MEIRPASIETIKALHGGQMVAVGADVLDVAKRVEEIHPDLRLHYSEVTGRYAVIQLVARERAAGGPEFDEVLVTTAEHLDERLLNRLREITSDGYDFFGELEAREAADLAERDRLRSEKIGDGAERVEHALRHDLGVKSRIVVPSVGGTGGRPTVGG